MFPPRPAPPALPHPACPAPPRPQAHHRAGAVHGNAHIHAALCDGQALPGLADLALQGSAAGGGGGLRTRKRGRTLVHTLSCTRLPGCASHGFHGGLSSSKDTDCRRKAGADARERKPFSRGTALLLLPRTRFFRREAEALRADAVSKVDVERWPRVLESS